MKKIVLLVFSLFATYIGFAQHWNPTSGFSDGMIILGYVTIDGVEPEFSEAGSTLDFELACFIDGDCRGYYESSWGWVEAGNDETDHWCLYPTVYGNSNETGKTVTFKLWDGEIEYESEVTVTWNPLVNEDHCIGCDGNFVEISFFTAQPTQPYTLDITGYGENVGGYYLIASPVTEGIEPSEDNGFITDAYDLYYFDQNGDSEGNEWINYEPNTFTIQSKKGYLYASQTDTQLQFAGTACTDGNVPLEYSTTNPSTFMHGWNLIGNPLAVDATISKACYVMNGSGTELEAAASGKLIPAMNGVFVKAEGAGESVTFIPSNNSGEGAKIDINVLKDRGATIDRAIVCLGEGGTLPKFMLHPENTKIYIEQGGDDYAVVSSNEDEIPVSFKAASNGTYTLNIAVQNAEMDYLHLIDNLAGTDTDLLANPNYTFEANTGDYASRFTLVLRNTTGLEEHFAFFNGHNWTVSNQGEATLQVIDVTGRLVSTKTIDGTTQLDVNAAPGVYMFRLVNGNDVKVQKVVVR